MYISNGMISFTHEVLRIQYVTSRNILCSNLCKHETISLPEINLGTTATSSLTIKLTSVTRVTHSFAMCGNNVSIRAYLYNSPVRKGGKSLLRINVVKHAAAPLVAVPTSKYFQRSMCTRAKCRIFEPMLDGAKLWSGQRKRHRYYLSSILRISILDNCYSFFVIYRFIFTIEMRTITLYIFLEHHCCSVMLHFVHFLFAAFYLPSTLFQCEIWSKILHIKSTSVRDGKTFVSNNVYEISLHQNRLVTDHQLRPKTPRNVPSSQSAHYV